MGKKRTYGTGGLHEKHGSYYGRWRTLDGRQLNRPIGPVRTAGAKTGLTRSQAEAAFRRLRDEEERAPRPARDAVVPTVDDVTDSLRKKLRLRGLRRSYLQGCESMQRVHISPRLGSKPVSDVKTAHIESVASAMLDRGLAPKTVRNVMTFLHSIFEHAIDRRLIGENPVRRATRPGRRRRGDANPAGGRAVAGSNPVSPTLQKARDSGPFVCSKPLPDAARPTRHGLPAGGM